MQEIPRARVKTAQFVKDKSRLDAEWNHAENRSGPIISGGQTLLPALLPVNHATLIAF